jgi:hypothetical protein
MAFLEPLIALAPELLAGAEGAGAAGAAEGGGGLGGMMKNLAGGQFGGGGKGGGMGMPDPAKMATDIVGGALDMVGGVANAGFNAMLHNAE